MNKSEANLLVQCWGRGHSNYQIRVTYYQNWPLSIDQQRGKVNPGPGQSTPRQWLAKTKL